MLSAQLQAVRARIADAARRAGRPPESIRLVCVTKSVSLARIQEAVAAGATDVGENRVQEAAPKVAALGHAVRWHMIGHLQRNKAKAALGLFDYVHSVDTVELAQALERYAVSCGRTVPVFVEVNVSREPTKHGVTPDALAPLLTATQSLRHLQVRGLMTMAPVVTRPEAARPYFRALRELGGRFHLLELSMGMSQDFEVAVEEGATIVRIGSAIFRSRETEQVTGDT